MAIRKSKKDEIVVTSEQNNTPPPVVEKITANAVSNEKEAIENEEIDNAMDRLIKGFLSLSSEDRKKAIKLVKIKNQRSKYGKK